MRPLPFFALAVALAAAGAAWLARAELADRRAAFETEARIAHRVLSQRAVQHEAILASLVLLQPAQAEAERLPALFPQLQRVLRREGAAAWPDPALAVAEADSRRLRRAVLAAPALAQGRVLLVQAGDPASYALQVDLAAMVPAVEWPFGTDGPVHAALVLGDQQRVLAAGDPAAGAWRFSFAKVLAADSQPFELQAVQQVGPAALPWGAMAAWAAAVALATAAAAGWQRQRSARRRAEELLRLGQVGRLNALGELAAGMAHELNQPLTAVLANTQAAARLLADDETDDARRAMDQAVVQARRASEVLGRLRRSVERPSVGAALQPVPLAPALRSALELLAPECRRLGVAPRVDCQPATLAVRAEAVALEQIVHNLLANALHALAEVPAGDRRLALRAERDGASAVLAVQDSGPGIAPEALPRLFEPFFSTRPGGLGLGLSLCETLAAGMGGALSARNVAPRGAEFRLSLPVA